MLRKQVSGEEISYKKPKISKKDRRNAVLFLTPSLLGVLLFFVIPFFVIIYYAQIGRAHV